MGTGVPVSGLSPAWCRGARGLGSREREPGRCWQHRTGWGLTLTLQRVLPQGLLVGPGDQGSSSLGIALSRVATPAFTGTLAGRLPSLLVDRGGCAPPAAVGLMEELPGSRLAVQDGSAFTYSV